MTKRSYLHKPLLSFVFLDLITGTSNSSPSSLGKTHVVALLSQREPLPSLRLKSGYFGFTCTKKING